MHCNRNEKNAFDGIISRLSMAEERDSKLQNINRVLKIEKQKEQRLKETGRRKRERSRKHT